MTQDLEDGAAARDGHALAGTHDDAREAHRAAAHGERVQRRGRLAVLLGLLPPGALLDECDDARGRGGGGRQAELRGRRDEAARAHLGRRVQRGALDGRARTALLARVEHDQRGRRRGGRSTLGHSPTDKHQGKAKLID